MAQEYVIKMEDHRIIGTVRSYEYLYNTNMTEYKNVVLKREAWQEISSKLNMPVSECKTKWNQLRNAFLHALARRKAATNLKNFSKWKYEDEMAFLLPYMGQKDAVSNIENNDRDDVFCTSQSEELNEDNILNYKDEKRQSNKKKLNYHDKIIKRHKEEGQNQRESLTNTKSASSSGHKEKDEIDLLFESMAKTVKKFPKTEQIKVKLEMMKIISDAEMRIETGISYQTLSPYDCEPYASPQYVSVRSPSTDSNHLMSSPQYLNSPIKEESLDHILDSD